MIEKKQILIIIGSAATHSANEQIAKYIRDIIPDIYDCKIYNELKVLPHFDPDLSAGNVPDAISTFRGLVEKAAAVIISTPEYVFSIPSGLKNALEWCVATTIFEQKPVGIITASASGIKGHEELQLIMKTLGAVIAPGATLLIQGVKGKVNAEGMITDTGLEGFLEGFISTLLLQVSTVK